MLFFWQFFRFSRIEMVFLASPQTAGAALLCSCLAIGVMLVFGLVSLAIQGWMSRLLARRWPVLLVAAIDSLSCLLLLLSSSVPAIQAIAWALAVVFIIARGTTILLLLFAWGSAFANAALSLRPLMLGILVSFALSFLVAILDSAISPQAPWFSVLMASLSALFWFLTNSKPAPYNGRAFAGFKDLPVLIFVLLVGFLLVGVGIGGSINDTFLDMPYNSTALIKHAATIASALVLMLITLYASSYLRLIYTTWIFTAAVFIVGLFITATLNPSWLLFGTSLVTVGRAAFELILFALCVLNPRQKDTSLIAMLVLFFVVPEALASILGRGVIPSVAEASGLSAHGFLGPLSIAMGVLLLVCIILVLSNSAIKTIDAVTPAQATLEPADKATQLTANIQTAAASYDLTQKEAEVAEYLFRGYSVQRIASTLVISKNTVQSHTKNIYRKMGVHSRQALIDAIESSSP
jgi:DNA-binding CsgD family transcriptional regulator